MIFFGLYIGLLE